MDPKVGDWIRFMHGGRLVIAMIAYLRPRSAWDSTVVYVTDTDGTVALESILELRPGVHP